MSITISKTDYLIYRDCPKNAWFKKHKPEIYNASELSAFERLIIDTGNEVDEYAQQLFPTGVAVDGRDEKAEEDTQKFLGKKVPTIFQPVFRTENFLAACDILKYHEEDDSYSIHEVKASNDLDKNVHYYDLAFQLVLLRMCGLNVKKTFLIHLNRDYVRQGEVEITKLFSEDDVTEEIEEKTKEVEAEMEVAFQYLSQEAEPKGNCKCISTKGRKKHCTTFAYSNPEVPAYSVHDISRIGLSKAKLKNLIEDKVLHITDVPDDLKLSDAQRNQIEAYKYDKVTIKREAIREELGALQFPIYFLDYETFPAAIPRFDGYTPYQQIPFQYSLHILHKDGEEPEHKEFLYTGSEDPAIPLVEQLSRDIGPMGSVIVWYAPFERSRNEEMGKRVPGAEAFMSSVNARLYDLRDIFEKQYYVDKNFKGSTSIKKVLPVLAPQLSYKVLGIQEGATATESWNQVATGKATPEERARIEHDLKVYCGLDTYAMYAIYKALRDL